MPTKATWGLFILLLVPVASIGQGQPLTNVDEAIQLALENNHDLRAEDLAVAQQQKLIGTALDIDKTTLYYSDDQNNIAENGFPISVWGIQQSFRFPTVYGAQRRVRREQYRWQQSHRTLRQRRLIRQVAQTYYRIVYWQSRQQVYRYLDSLYGEFARAADRRFELGETNYLEKLTAEARSNQLRTSLQQLEEDTYGAYQELTQLMQVDSAVVVAEQALHPLELKGADTTAQPGLAYYRQATQVAEATRRLEQHKLWPDLHLQYFEGTNNYAEAQVYRGIQVGVSVPLWFGAARAGIQAASLARDQSMQQAQSYQHQLTAERRRLRSQLSKYRRAVSYYENTGQRLATELFKAARRNFQEGEIDFLQYVQSLDNATSIELDYLENLNAYNQTLLELTYLVL